MISIYTIGVYGWDEKSFIDALEENEIDALIDIRSRRAVRGRIYSFANAKKLENILSGAAISYRYMKELSPTREVRNVQAASDQMTNVSKGKRSHLSDDFIKAYSATILSNIDSGALFQTLGQYRHPCLLCVEGPASACHRSIVSELISRDNDIPLHNIARH
ncbi:DUF488 family protein [Paracoccus litorisediminis]|uniref:DUF488 family protein n=1 Tax=Paracoccus litorisediminis TaxID=2006130 RepID=UPI00373337FB